MLIEKGETMLSKCGVNCSSDCKAYQVDCDGCTELEGKVSWAPFYGKDACPIYECANTSGYQSCGECGQAPCSIWYDTKNPDITDAEFEVDIQSRLTNMRSE
jgi:hypothetical protein